MTVARVGAHRVLVVAMIATACTKSRERERFDFERMRVQQRYDGYGASAVFANGLSMQAPPLGTRARESAPDPGVVGTGLSGGVLVRTVPVAITPERLALGRQKFTVYCAVCHGAAAFGGSVVAENMGPPRPPSLRSAPLLAQPAGYFFSVATHGKGRMPPYAAQLTVDERWSVVAYIQHLQHAAISTAEERADSVRAIEIWTIDSTLAARGKP